MSEIELKQDMIYEALLIIKSCEWAEKQINKKLIEIEKTNNFELKGRLEKEIKILISKLNLENINMSNFMKKYNVLVNNAKKTVLSSNK